MLSKEENEEIERKFAVDIWGECGGRMNQNKGKNDQTSKLMGD